jgi:type I restriction enzyme M protein
MTPERLNQLENRLWEAADELRANSGLSAQEYSRPVLGLIFLRYAEARFVQAKEEIDAEQNGSSRRRRSSSRKAEFQERGVMFVPEEALYSDLLELPEGADVSEAVVAAMKAIERENPALKDVLPKTYRRIRDETLANLLKYISWIPVRAEGDAFGQIYEYFLGKFALEEGRGGGEFFTPTAIVKLIVEIIEPFHGQVYDPACGSGGMFVQSARFVEEHSGSPSSDLTVFGQEKTSGTIRLAKMNLAVHGLEGIIKRGNSYYEDEHRGDRPFDFVMANPPFNVDKVDKERLKGDPRFPLGMPSVDNANYLWVQLFLSALNEDGRAGFVMPNSAADARHSEQTLRQKLVEEGVVDVIVSVGSNFFYTVTLPCTLWFLDTGTRGAAREDDVVFIESR